jgi:hypothetical protein
MFITVAFAQESIVRGKITYIAGESVYTSLGRESGVKDSSMLYVFSNLDTITTLIVFATSSKSSVCKIIKTKRQLHIGDIVNTVIRIMDKSAQEQKRPSPIADTTQTIPQPALFVAQNIARQQPSQPFASFQGSFSLQYFTIREASYSLNISQPVAALNLRGRINETPIKFQLYGNFRSLKYGSTRPFNQTRIYRLSIDYDDEINQIPMRLRSDLLMELQLRENSEVLHLVQQPVLSRALLTRIYQPTRKSFQCSVIINHPAVQHIL